MPGSPRAELRERPMSARRVRTSERSRRASNLSSSRALLATVVLLVAVASQRPGKAADDLSDALPYSLSYTVTGDYAVGGVDFVPSAAPNGFQTDTIHMGTAATRIVPKNAEILAAFLYWETLASSPDDLQGVLFRGAPVTFVRTLDEP